MLSYCVGVGVWHVIAIYTVHNSKIVEVRFIQGSRNVGEELPIQI